MAPQPQVPEVPQDYVILVSPTPEALRVQVLEKKAAGYQLYGYPWTQILGSRYTKEFYQCMVLVA